MAPRRRKAPARKSSLKASDAPLSLPHFHAWPQHGGRARPLARHRHARRRFRQADHRGRQFLHPVRARPRAPEGPRPAGGARDRGGGRGRQGVQHHRHRRRHRDGPRRHALFAALARGHRRQRRIHGQRPLRRCAGVHLELRQDHARHADGGAAPQHPRRVRLRRADGGRQGQALDRRAQGRPHRRDGRGGRRKSLRRRRGGDRALRLPDLRLLLGHVHRQFDELPHRGAWALAAGQRHGGRDARRPPAPVRRGRPSRRRSRPPLVRGRRRRRRCRAESPLFRRSRTR